MGWCSATRIFDAVAEALLSEVEPDKKAMLKMIADTLEEHDWDCQQDSNYWDHPLVREVMKELHPDWDFTE